MRQLKQLTVFFMALLCSTTLLAQKQTVTGKVTDAKGDPLAGVSVNIKGSNAGTSTDNNGMFSIQADGKDVLEFSIVGYQSQKININGKSTINVSLQPVQTELSEVVFVGTRGGGRAKLETAVPVDIIRINQIGLLTAKTDLTSVLNIAAPSFNYNKQTGADGADHIDVGTLRGLTPDLHWY
ncbi:MAG: carboxypeptidase-like regulatory domain-containing protein [Sphingobacteriales bacterium]|nr:carboxypeptidase-like regulatory domain-containing protein [Sphingobacteriales bacterium]MBI3718344.1 carboxypeptidase-like regulatory domain-containing protein [Sphingobacteriales bacterium]